MSFSLWSKVTTDRILCRPISRRDVLRHTALGFGALGLTSMLTEPGGLLAESTPGSPLSPKRPHFAPRAKRVIYLFMHGGPSHVDTFDPKPRLVRDNGNP